MRSFLGVLQCYRDIWRRRSHLISPLSDLVPECGNSKTKKEKPKKQCRTAEHQQTFEEFKRTVSEVLYSRLVRQARVLNTCQEHYLRCAEYNCAKNNDLSSLVSLYKEVIFRAGSLLIRCKRTGPLVCRILFLRSKRSKHALPKPGFMGRKNVAKPFIEVFSASHEKPCIYWHGTFMSRSSHNQRVERSGSTFFW